MIHNLFTSSTSGGMRRPGGATNGSSLSSSACSWSERRTKV